MAFTPVTFTEEQRKALEEKHEDILVLKGNERAPWLAVMKRPSRQEAVGYKTHAKRDQATANEQLLRAIIVHPTGEDLEKQLARWPLFVDGIVDTQAFRDFVGISVDDSLK
jgi:hypothetical protein